MYTDKELKAFHTILWKLTRHNCADCQLEAAIAIEQVKKYLSETDLKLLLNAWSRSKVIGSSHARRLVLAIYVRLDVNLDHLLIDSKSCPTP